MLSLKQICRIQQSYLPIEQQYTAKLSSNNQQNAAKLSSNRSAECSKVFFQQSSRIQQCSLSRMQQSYLPTDHQNAAKFSSNRAAEYSIAIFKIDQQNTAKQSSKRLAEYSKAIFQEISRIQHSYLPTEQQSKTKLSSNRAAE